MMRIGKPYGIRETGHDKRTNERDSNIPNTIRRNLFTIRSCGTMIYTEEQITKAVELMVESWDTETLRNFAIEERLDYYLGKNVSQEEIEILIEEH